MISIVAPGGISSLLITLRFAAWKDPKARVTSVEPVTVGDATAVTFEIGTLKGGDPRGACAQQVDGSDDINRWPAGASARRSGRRGPCLSIRGTVSATLRRERGHSARRDDSARWPIHHPGEDPALSNVAVTGADGFIGSHLVEALVARGDNVRALAQYNSFGSWGWLDRLPKDTLGRVDIVLGDVRDAGCVLDFLRDAGVVYHLAALIAIPYSYRAPRSYVDTNVSGTLNILEAARTLGSGRVVVTSTSEVYGTARSVPISEEHPLQSQSPYAASKIGADKLAESYHLSFELPVVTLRPFNTFGPRQSARAVIPTIITQLAAGERRVNLGNLAPTRDFCYVRDTVAAFLAVGAAPAGDVVGRVLNAGTGVETSIGDLAETIARLMDRDIELNLEDQRFRPDASEVMRLVCDSRALRTATGWSPQWSLEDGLRETIGWFTEPTNLAAYKSAEYNV